MATRPTGMVGQNSLQGGVALRPTGLRGAPITNVENPCASGSSARRSSPCPTRLPRWPPSLRHRHQRHERIHQRLGGNPRGPIFVDIYADSARRSMDRHEVTSADLAQVVVKSRTAGALNESAQFRTSTTVGEVLSMRAVAGPLALAMRSPIGNGAAAPVVMSAEQAQCRGHTAVSIDASVPFIRRTPHSVHPPPGRTPVGRSSGHSHRPCASRGRQHTDRVGVGHVQEHSGRAW